MSLTPEFLLETIFPQGSFGSTHSGIVNTNEINGLSKGTQPQNCKVLISGEDKLDKNRREFYLIESGNTLFYLRICTAYPNSGYEEFVVIHKIATSNTEDGNKLIKRAVDVINNMCINIKSNMSNLNIETPTL